MPLRDLELNLPNSCFSNVLNTVQPERGRPAQIHMFMCNRHDVNTKTNSKFQSMVIHWIQSIEIHRIPYFRVKKPIAQSSCFWLKILNLCSQINFSDFALSFKRYTKHFRQLVIYSFNTFPIRLFTTTINKLQLCSFYDLGILIMLRKIVS